MPDPIIQPPGLPQGTGAVLPVHARRGSFVPTVGGYLNVVLPGEIVRTEVEQVLTRDVVMVRIKTVTMHNASHTLKFGDPIAVQRHVGELSEEWVPINDREVREREEMEKAERAAKERSAPESPDTEGDVPVREHRHTVKVKAKRNRVKAA